MYLQCVSIRFFYTCVNTPNLAPGSVSGSFGYIKPAFTDIDPLHPEAYFRVMILFVQFANETGADISWWPIGFPPAYMNEMLAASKRNPVGGNWWDNYSESTELISDYWLEQSRGRFHVIGEEVNVVLDHDYYYYQAIGSFNRVNDDVYTKLMSMNINWTKFDKWKIVDSPGSMDLTYEPDGYVDMIYKIHPDTCSQIRYARKGNSSAGTQLFTGI